LASVPHSHPTLRDCCCCSTLSLSPTTPSPPPARLLERGDRAEQSSASSHCTPLSLHNPSNPPELLHCAWLLVASVSSAASVSLDSLSGARDPH
jgi:hypothetical protein